MAATKSRPGGSGATVKARDTGDALASAARNAPAPALAAAAAAAGLAGGLALGSRAARHGVLGRPRRKVLGLAVGRRSATRALAHSARRAVVAARKASDTADDIRAIRMQLENLNRRSPIEIVLDGLTHRRGAHRVET
jgi:hypothetical protein